LALVGDAADGFPGLVGWGAKSAAKLLARYLHLEAIPPDAREWDVTVGSSGKLADVLSRERDRAFLFRTLATLRTDIELFDDVESLRYRTSESLAASLRSAEIRVP
jgi:5'-3' exonuclease